MSSGMWVGGGSGGSALWCAVRLCCAVFCSFRRGRSGVLLPLYSGRRTLGALCRWVVRLHVQLCLAPVQLLRILIQQIFRFTEHDLFFFCLPTAFFITLHYFTESGMVTMHCVAGRGRLSVCVLRLCFYSFFFLSLLILLFRSLSRDTDGMMRNVSDFFCFFLFAFCGGGNFYFILLQCI